MTNISDLFNHFMSLINLKYYTKIESDSNFSQINHTHTNYVTTSDSRLSDARTPLSHTHIEYTNPTICDDLITNDNTQVLSAKQGKVLKDLIGDAITYINQ